MMQALHQIIKLNPQKENTMQPKNGDIVTLTSGETGTIVGTATYTENVPNYLVRYKAADGRLTENWWPQSAFAA
jgi:hypothetical protein